MKTRTYLFTLLFIMTTTMIQSQEKITFQTPPREIMELVDVERAPAVDMDSRQEQMLFYYRNNFKSLAELKQPELRLGGLRINPDANISSTITYYNNIRYKRTVENDLHPITGLPADARMAYFSFSPEETKLAFTNTTDQGVELWVIDLTDLTARRITQAILNANAGMPYSWFPDGSSLLVQMLPTDRPSLIDAGKALPEGPIVSVSEGQISQNRTYQDLLKNPVDELNFERLITSELYRVHLNGDADIWKEAGMYIDQEFSPDGDYLLLTTLEHPFSYVVPWYSFPNRTDLFHADGRFLNLSLSWCFPAKIRKVNFSMIVS